LLSQLSFFFMKKLGSIDENLPFHAECKSVRSVFDRAGR